MSAIQAYDTIRQIRITKMAPSHKALFAQYLTPIEIARYMSKLTVSCWESPYSEHPVEILDPGAGSGILSCCLVDELLKEHNNLPIHLDSYELDKTILGDLEQSYRQLACSAGLHYTIHNKDFITTASPDIFWNINKKYDLIIMNPPYKKINTNTEYRRSLSDIGIEIVNTYSAFMSLAIKLLKENGILTAIVPRSFCNGPYFLPFRKFLLSNTAILHLHSFESRGSAFKDESVLQENVIITLKKTEKKNKSVCISFSKDKQFSAYTEKKTPLSQIVSPDDSQLFISIPHPQSKYKDNFLTHSNTDLEFNISTGPIVDFRANEKLIFGIPDKGAPLLYSVHLRNHKITWPVESKKPNAIILNKIEIPKLAFPKGYYVLVKRFSSKEEHRRLYATLLTPNSLPHEYFTVENHINIIHHNHSGLSKDIATGLCAYLNTEYCDTIFRTFSGHTQVNATDLKNMKYPSQDFLIQLGKLTTDADIEKYDLILKDLINNAQ